MAIKGVLDNQPWRTTQRENPDDYEQRATAGKWALILGAIIRYQNRHRGMSPTDLMISMETKMSPGTVQYHIKQMQKAGLIKDNNGWPRIITVSATAKTASVGELKRAMTPKPQKVEEAKTMDTEEFKMGTHKEREDFYTVSQKIARAVVDFTYANDRPPYMKEVAKALGYTSAGSCNGLIRKMVTRGWLSHSKGKQHDLKVTGLGRTALLGNGQPEQQPETRAAPPYMEVRRAAPPPAEAAPAPEPAPAPERPSVVVAVRDTQTTPDLSGFDTVDLLLELQSRGLKVSR